MAIQLKGLTADDDTTKIKITISGEELVEPTTFTVEDLIDAGELKENTGEDFPGMAESIDSYYEMSVDKFNSIIGTDITKLSKYILSIQEDGRKYIRVVDNTSLPTVYDLLTTLGIAAAGTKEGKTEEELHEIAGFDYSIDSSTEDKLLSVSIYLGNDTVKVFITRSGVNDQIDGKLCTSKQDIPESLLKAELHLLNSMKANKLIN